MLARRVVGGEFDEMTIRVIKVDGVNHLVILEFKLNAFFFKR